MDLDEAALRRAHDARRRREIAHPGRIDDGRVGPRPQAVPAGGRRGVPALGVAGQLGGLRGRLRRERIDDRGLADARLADQQGHADPRAPAQAPAMPAPVSDGHFQAREVQGAIGGELRLIDAAEVRIC